MYMQSEATGHRQTYSKIKTGPFKDRLIEAKAQLITAVLANQNSYVQSDDAPLRYRLLTDTALRLVELNHPAAYFDLTDLAYQYDLTTWVQNTIRLLTIQLNIPMPNGRWWAQHAEDDPIDCFMHFLEDKVLNHGEGSILLSFDEADKLQSVPLATEFWRLLYTIAEAVRYQPAFERLTIVLWGEISWQELNRNGRFPQNSFKSIIL